MLRGADEPLSRERPYQSGQLPPGIDQSRIVIQEAAFWKTVVNAQKNAANSRDETMAMGCALRL